jgi:iron complex transport system substrate-binding protein
MKKKILILLVLLLPIFVFAQGAAEKQMSANISYTAEDASGRTVTLKTQPTRVIIAGKAGNMPANALFLFPEVASMDLTLPITNQGLGDFFSLIRPTLDEKPRISQNASAEEIAAQNPELVLTKTANYEKIGKKLDQLGIPNFTMNLETYEDWKNEITQLGNLLGNPTRAAQILDMYESRLSSLSDAVATLSEGKKQRVLFLQGVTSDNATSFKIAPDSWMQTWMAETSGGIPVWKGANKASNGWSTVSFEQIAAWNPDKIYILSYKTPTDSFVNEIYSSSLWANLKAVQNHEVKQTPSDMMNYIQPVATWILGLQWLAKDLYPELFTTVDMQEELVSFYKEFYTITDAQILDSLLGSYQASLSLN